MKHSSMDRNTIFHTSHIILLMTFTIMSIALTAEIFLMDWEKWIIFPLLAAVAFCWNIHIQETFSRQNRLTIYVLCVLFAAFLYGIHLSSTYDVALLMCAVILLCTTTGIKLFITASQICFFIIFGYDLVTLITTKPEALDGEAISRIILQVVLMLLIGWLARMVIDLWTQVLEQTKSEVKNLTEATGRLNNFLTSVSHEIRTPINAVMGLSEICMEHTKDPQELEYLSSIRGAGQRMTELIGDILDYSDLDRKQIALNMENYMPASFLHDLVQELRPYLKKEVEFVIDVDPTLPMEMYTDVSKLKKILWHLATNALKFTKEGGVYMRITHEKRDYGINLLVDVQDTGTGLSETDKERLFDGFSKANGSRARSSGGLGLGMAIVTGFVSCLGGFIRVESSPESGTLMHISIPQRVIDPSPCMEVKDKENLVPCGFFRFEKFTHPMVREYYNSVVRNIAVGADVLIHRVDNLENLQKLSKAVRLTHLCIAQREYEANPDYIEELAKTVDVSIVCDPGFTLRPGAKSHLMEKPMYSFPVVMALNRKPGEVISHKYLCCRGVRALVVDDEPLNLTVAKNLLSRYCIQVDTCPSGAAAVEKCAKERFNIIFMDHMMPGMDGIECMLQIRSSSLGVWKSIPFIALTANASSTARETFQKAGFDGFLAKPIDIPEMERLLRSLLPASLVSFTDAPQGQKECPLENAGDAATMTTSPPSSESRDFYAPLRELGVDIQTGRNYCLNDDEFYQGLLKQFVQESRGKKRELEQFFQSEGLSDYCIRIHALKSTAKMIGALSLSEKARALEEASKNENLSLVKEGHPKVMEEYETLIEAIQKTLGMEAEDGNQEPGKEEALEEDEILEFDPAEEEDDGDILTFEPEGGL